MIAEDKLDIRLLKQPAKGIDPAISVAVDHIPENVQKIFAAESGGLKQLQKQIRRETVQVGNNIYRRD